VPRHSYEVPVSRDPDVVYRGGLPWSRTDIDGYGSYKGMAASSSQGGGSAPRTPTRVTPQQTGFSQAVGRPHAANESTGAAMSVLLSWHEKVVEVAGLGCVGRTMTDWRKV
jgi:hypothetical protein